MNELWIFGELWCPDTVRIMQFLESRGIPYEWVDTQKDPKARRFVIKLVGKFKIPVVFFPDGSYLVEPTNEELASKLGISSGCGM